MTESILIIGLVLCIISSYALVAWIGHEDRKEREDLQDRLMSIAQPVALVTHDSVRSSRNTEATVSYVDEAREAELSPSWQS